MENIRLTTGLAPSWVGLSMPFIWNILLTLLRPLTPVLRLVWALPLSLAATDGIDFSFFSFRY